MSDGQHHLLRVFDGGQEVPRDPGWRASAHPDPWGVSEMLDGRWITFWLCGHTMQPGQFVEVEFGQARTMDAVRIDTAPNQYGIGLELEGRDASGAWKTLARQPEIRDVPAPPGLRRAAAEELKRRNVDYLLLFDGDFGAADLRQNSALWGVREVGEYQGARLYQLP